MEKKEGKITNFNVVLQTVKSNQLSAEEETELMAILKTRDKNRKFQEMKRTLSGVIQTEMQRRADFGEIKRSTLKRYRPLIKRCFIETEFGNLDASEITSETEVDEFILSTYDTCTLTWSETMHFLSWLKMGLRKLSEEGILGFELEDRMFRYRIIKMQKIRSIRNPYSVQEMEAIMEWIDHNQGDVRALAVKLFFSDQITISQIINLRIDDVRDNKNESEDIIKKAIALHPEGGEYVFMVKKEGNWGQLSNKSLQTKLYFICRAIGIKYKPIIRDSLITS